MITAIGMILGPICLWFWRRPAILLALILIYSVFSAAAVAVFGSFGVTPALVPAAMFVGMFMISRFNGIKYPAERPALLMLGPFMLVIFGAFCSSFVMPRLFQGEVLVWPQKVDSFFTRSPLAPNAGNITQDMYLLVDAALATTGAIYLTRRTSLPARLIDAYFSAGLLAVAISIWQFAGNVLHIPYPSQFFLSNPGWALLSAQKVGWLIRLNGPFSEPSALSSYMCGSVSAAGWVILNGDRRLLPRVTFWSALIIVLLTTASTGIVTLLIMVGLALLRSAFSIDSALRRRLALGVMAAFFGVGLLVVLVPLAVPGARSEFALVLEGTLNKNQSESYVERSTLDLDSIQELKETYGLGVGWGSNRSSSLVPGLGAAIGIWGLAGFTWFAISLTCHARKAMRLTRDPSLHYAIRGSSAALISNLVSALLSAPTITPPDFYVMLAILVACAARARHEANPYRRKRSAEQIRPWQVKA